MFRLPLMATLFWLLLGLSLGWWLHSSYTLTPSTITTAGTSSANTNAASAVTPNIEAKSYRSIPAQPERTQKSLSQTEQIALRKTAQTLLQNNAHQAEQMLTSWTQRDPDNPEPMLLLAQAHFRSGRYQQALNIALELYSYPQNAVLQEDVKNLLEQIEQQYSEVLYKQQRFDQLIALYQTLIDRMPENKKVYYKLAELQTELGLSDDALNTLNYILYDAIWGQRAQKLAARVQLQIDLQGETQIPLEKIDNQFIVTVTINGIPGTRLLIDTGASICVLRPQIARNLGLDINEDEEITVNLPAGVVNTPITSMDSLEMDDMRIENLIASIIEMPPGIETDGLLGMNFLGNFRFFIDQEEAILYLGAK